jgi:DNA-binding NtrC family response regulator
MTMQRTVLVVDDNDINRLNLKLLLKDNYQVIEAGDLDVAEEMLTKHRVELLILDLALPPEPDNPEIGMQYLTEIREENPDLPVVVITGHDEHRLAVRARRAGALDFFGKPFDPDEVRDTIDRAMESRWQQLREQELQRMLDTRMGTEILGDSDAMDALRQLIARVAPTPSTVLVQGPTGSGKELVARSLHAQSPRQQRPFIAINCASMAAEHLESELFGHEKGAFAGAAKRKLGWFERAAGGTLFLDEVAGLPLSVQAKLLRALEHGEFSRLGGESILRSDVRLICSTKENIEQLVEEGSFREDLYYRIHVVVVDVPPLSEHAEDIPVLAQRILEQKAMVCAKPMQGIAGDVIDALQRYAWPGNVRELENVIERAVVLAAGSVIERLPSLASPQAQLSDGDLLDQWFEQLSDTGLDAEKTVADFERRLLLEALDRNQGVKARAGRWLGFGERAKDKMRYLCEKYGIQVDDL